MRSRRNGVPHAYLAFEGEGHGFRRAETVVGALEAELAFLGQIFGFETPGVPRARALALSSPGRPPALLEERTNGASFAARCSPTRAWMAVPPSSCSCARRMPCSWIGRDEVAAVVRHERPDLDGRQRQRGLDRGAQLVDALAGAR